MLLQRSKHPGSKPNERGVLYAFASCLVSSQQDGAELERLAPGARVVTVPNVCDATALGGLKRCPRAARIVFVGRMSYGPNILAVEEFVSEVLPRIAINHTDLEFRIVGASPHRRVRRLTYKRHVHVTGFVPDIRAELAKATVSVCNVPVAGGTQYKILESLAAAAPVVTNHGTAEPLGLRDREHVMIADQPIATADAITELIEDYKLACRSAVAGQEHIRDNFGLEVSVSGLLSEYERCTSGASMGAGVAAGC